MNTHNGLSPEQQAPGSLELSFNVYHGTVAMGAIFVGFVFSSLLEILLSQDPLTPAKKVVLWLLTWSMILLSAALVFFHTTAHRFINWCKAPYPRSVYSRAGIVCFTVGLTFMFCSIGVLMFQRGLHVLMAITMLFGFGIASFRALSTAFIKTENIIDVDKSN